MIARTHLMLLTRGSRSVMSGVAYPRPSPHRYTQIKRTIEGMANVNG